jgi:2-keto-3-deoxy-L-rhamnonate aldolase RhmA
LVNHLRLMGESNALMVKRGTPLRRDTALAAAAAYQHLYCEGMEDEDAMDNIAATYQVRGVQLLLFAVSDCAADLLL